MTAYMDTLAYAKRLADAGVPREHAEAHAEASRDFVMSQVATKADISELKNLIERQSLILTVRLGGILAIGIGALTALQKLV